MPLAAGTPIGPYQVVSPLGTGGMGEVYRARDPRLGRDVAIKVLPQELAHDPERLARFEREARTLAAMNHPGIAAIFGVEEVGSSRALVMELVEGPTLADRLTSGPMPEDEAVVVARQLADALEYAHELGIVHRDLKPANVKLRSDGTAKVLDFGLARALETDAISASGELSHSPTITHRMTQAGVILGTAAYMAPEQARGRPADRRADVWAWGAVVYELLTGRRAFAGETVSDTLASVMRDSPDWSLLPRGVSPGWRRLLERCLEKDVKQRLQAIGEARIALADLDAFDGASAHGTAAPRAARRGIALRAALPWVIVALALAALVVTWRQRRPSEAASELSIVPAGGERVAEDAGYHPLAISPDARSIAYTVRKGGELRVRIRRLDRREDVELAGLEGARNLFFSRDGEWLGFFDTRKMCKVSVRGGAPVELADALQDRLGAWLDDGTIVYSRNTTEPLYRISEKGGAPVAITRLDSTRRERTHRFPCALDGGPWVVFTAQTVDSPGGYDDADIEAVSVKTGERRHLFKGARRAAWAPGGHLILARGNDLYAVPIDPRNPRVTRDPVPVLSGVAGETSSGASYFAIADDGTIAWLPHGGPDEAREVGWFDRSGHWTPTPVPPGTYSQLVIAPDGARALVSVGPGGGSQDLWLADLRNGGMNRLTHGGRTGLGAWFPDGLRIACSERDSTVERVVIRRLDGAGGTHELSRATHPLIISDVTPDGQDVLYSDYGLIDGRQYLVRATGDAPPRTLPADGDGYELGGRVSPDGRWIAYISNKTRREEVCIRNLAGGGGNWQISQRGSGVRWGREGRELFFVSNEILHRASVAVHGDELTVGQPEPLFEVPPTATEAAFRDYDYDPISDRFLFTRPPRGAADRREIAISLGWAKRLGSMLAAKGH